VESFGGVGGSCLSVCDEDAFPYNEGCPEGLECVEADRFGEPAAQRFVCAPDFNATVTEESLSPIPESDEPVDPEPDPGPEF